jgi:hydrogenase expression/formation protein HypE
VATSVPLDIKHGRVDMTHGSGGRAMAQLIEELFAAASATNIWPGQRRGVAAGAGGGW